MYLPSLHLACNKMGTELCSGKKHVVSHKYARDSWHKTSSTCFIRSSFLHLSAWGELILVEFSNCNTCQVQDIPKFNGSQSFRSESFSKQTIVCVRITRIFSLPFHAFSCCLFLYRFHSISASVMSKNVHEQANWQLFTSSKDWKINLNKCTWYHFGDKLFYLYALLVYLVRYSFFFHHQIIIVKCP